MQTRHQIALLSKSSVLPTIANSGGIAVSLIGGNAVRADCFQITGDALLLERMVDNSISELLVRVVKDLTHGLVISLVTAELFTEPLDHHANPRSRC